ncbi:MAG: methyltransferase domain-containing protein [Planctomycetes bacterium]|nr:methyltransferase domain-containing protein [Planctomycetota bacterium]
MRRRHLEALRPVCPVCRGPEDEAPLEVARVEREAGDDLLEGTLVCARPRCQREFPVLDGVPLIVPDVRSFVAENVFALMARDDLSETLEGALGDCAGPGSWLDVSRQHLSSYAWDHYGDLDPEEPPPDPARGDPAPGGLRRVLAAGLALAPAPPPGPALDVGCAVGRTAFELAALPGRADELVLGVDLNVGMLRLASRVLRQGAVRYPRRRVGLVYDRREFPAALPGAERIDFWCCDATALPFPAGTFGLAASLHVLDCIAAPVEHLATLGRALRPGGVAVLAAPYDWATSVTPLERWLGGHSQRAPHGGASEAALRHLLTGERARALGLELVAEREDVPWAVRMHARSAVRYSAHVVAARATGGAA